MDPLPLTQSQPNRLPHQTCQSAGNGIILDSGAPPRGAPSQTRHGKVVTVTVSLTRRPRRGPGSGLLAGPRSAARPVTGPSNRNHPPRRRPPKLYINAAAPPSRKPPLRRPTHSPNSKTRGSASPPKREAGRGGGKHLLLLREIYTPSPSLSFLTPIPRSRWPRLDPRRRGGWEAGSEAPPPGRPPESACGCSTAKCTSARWRCSR